MEEHVARSPKPSEIRPSGGNAGRPGDEARQEDATSPEHTGGGEMGNDAAAESSADPWSESDAGHPDESSSDTLDQHPQPDDETTRSPGV
jgi:hypothetical protein